jgi:hypothetical protein
LEGEGASGLPCSRELLLAQVPPCGDNPRRDLLPFRVFAILDFLGEPKPRARARRPRPKRSQLRSLKQKRARDLEMSGTGRCSSHITRLSVVPSPGLGDQRRTEVFSQGSHYS